MNIYRPLTDFSNDELREIIDSILSKRRYDYKSTMIKDIEEILRKVDEELAKRAEKVLNDQ